MSKTPASDLESIIKHESRPFWDAINGEDDLSCVLITVSYIEQCLESLLRRLLIEDEVANRVVGQMQLQRKLDILFCLGHVPPEVHHDIAQMAIIRNHFAHDHFQASFSDQKVNSAIDKLTIKSVIPEPLSNRDRFVSSAVTCSQIIQVHGLSAANPCILKWNGL